MEDKEKKGSNPQGKGKNVAVPMVVGAVLMGVVLFSLGNGTEEPHRGSEESGVVENTGGTGGTGELEEIYGSTWGSLLSVLEFMDMRLKENTEAATFYSDYIQGVGAVFLRTSLPSQELVGLLALHEKVLDYYVNAPLTMDMKDILISLLLTHNQKIMEVLQAVEEESRTFSGDYYALVNDGESPQGEALLEELKELHRAYGEEFQKLEERMGEDMNALG